MSVAGRKPFINKIIDACNKTQVKSVSNLLDNLGSAVTVSLFNTLNMLGANYEISDSLKTKATHVHFMLDSNKIIDGILVYLDNTHCGLFGLNDNTGVVTEFDIDPVNKSYVQINEHCTVEELRQVVSDRLIEVGDGDYVSESELALAVSDKVKKWTVGWDNENSLPDMSEIFPELGDIVVTEIGDTYIVSYLDDAELHLVRAEDLRHFMYDVEDGHLVYSTQAEWEDNVGTKLYKHDVSLGGPSMTLITSLVTELNENSFSQFLSATIINSSRNQINLMIDATEETWFEFGTTAPGMPDRYKINYCVRSNGEISKTPYSIVSDTVTEL